MNVEISDLFFPVHKIFIQKTLDIFAENVELNVDHRTRLDVVEIRDFVGEGDDRHGKVAFFGIHHRETDAIDGN